MPFSSPVAPTVCCLLTRHTRPQHARTPMHTCATMRCTCTAPGQHWAVGLCCMLRVCMLRVCMLRVCMLRVRMLRVCEFACCVFACCVFACCVFACCVLRVCILHIACCVFACWMFAPGRHWAVICPISNGHGCWHAVVLAVLTRWYCRRYSAALSAVVNSMLQLEPSARPDASQASACTTKGTDNRGSAYRLIVIRLEPVGASRRRRRAAL